MESDRYNFSYLCITDSSLYLFKNSGCNKIMWIPFLLNVTLDWQSRYNVSETDTYVQSGKLAVLPPKSYNCLNILKQDAEQKRI